MRAGERTVTIDPTKVTRKALYEARNRRCRPSVRTRKLRQEIMATRLWSEYSAIQLVAVIRWLGVRNFWPHQVTIELMAGLLAANLADDAHLHDTWWGKTACTLAWNRFWWDA